METPFSLDEIRKEHQREVSNEVDSRMLLKQVYAQQPGLSKAAWIDLEL